MRPGCGSLWKMEYSALMTDAVASLAFSAATVAAYTKLRKNAGTSERAAVALASALAAFIPLNGLSIKGLVLSISPSLSITTLVYIAAALSALVLKKHIFKRNEIAALAAFNIFFSTVVYASTLGLVSADIYVLGYGFSAITVCTGLAAAGLAILGSPLAYVFTGYLAAWVFGLYDSENLIDCMTDGVSLFISTWLIVRFAACSLRSLVRKKGASPESIET